MATQQTILSGRANRRTAARMRAFLAAYEHTGRLTEAARTAGIHRCTHYRRIETDPAYRKAFEAAEERAGQIFEDEAVKRAIVGVKRAVMYKGAPVKVGRRILYETQYSDTLLIALLKRFRPALYRAPQVITEHTESEDIGARLQAARQRLAGTRAAAG